MQSFATARTLLKVLEIVGWVVVAIALVGGLIAFAEGGLFALPAVIGGALSGILTVAFAQIGLAVVVTAESTQAMARKMGAIKGTATPEARPLAGAAAAGGSDRDRFTSEDVSSALGDPVETYRKRPIHQSGEHFLVGLRPFPTLFDAKRAIDAGEV
jgi:hypothetical protein